MQSTEKIKLRVSLPSKGRLEEDAMKFLAQCGLNVYRPNPRQYEAHIPALPGLDVIFQRAADIVVSVKEGSVDFGITGLDVIGEHQGEDGDILILHDALNFGECELTLAIPESWQEVRQVSHLVKQTEILKRPLRVATKYPKLTGGYLKKRDIKHVLITAEGTLETAPAIGYADMICDVVSSGQTLKDNRLVPLKDGCILSSQAALIANKGKLKNDPSALEMAHFLLEFFEAYLRANENLAIFANMRGDSPEAVADLIFTHCHIQGLQGPTISRVIVREDRQNWYAVNIIVPRKQLFQTITELRDIGGSGVVVMPVTYIFDEEPPRYMAMLKALGEG